MYKKKTFSPLTFFPLSVSVQFNWKTIWFWRVEMFSELFFPSLLICPAQQRHYRSCRMGRSVREATQSSTVRTAQKKRVKKFFYDRIRILESYWLLLVLELERNYVCGEVEMERENKCWIIIFHSQKCPLRLFFFCSFFVLFSPPPSSFALLRFPVSM